MNASRRLRWARHAFPRRFRAQRCTEIESTFQEADLAGDPKAYGTAALIDVVVAGWRERARTRLPLGPYLKYRLLAGRLDQRWYSWMFDDLGGWFPARRAAWTVSLLALIWVAVWRVSDGAFTLPESFFWLVWVIAASVTAGLERRRTLKRHGYDPRTRTWVPPVVVNWVPAPRRIRRAAPMLTGVVMALLVVAPLAAVTLSFPERSLRSITIGSFSFVRIVDHTVAAGWAAVALGCTLLAAGLAKRHGIATRVLVTADRICGADRSVLARDCRVRCQALSARSHVPISAIWKRHPARARSDELAPIGPQRAVLGHPPSRSRRKLFGEQTRSGGVQEQLDAGGCIEDESLHASSARA